MIGPDPAGASVAISEAEPSVFTWEEFRKPKCQANGEEILWQDSPIKRYGAGILFPFGVTELKQLAEEAATTPAGGEDLEPGPDIRIDEQQEKKVQDEAGNAASRQVGKMFSEGRGKLGPSGVVTDEWMLRAM